MKILVATLECEGAWFAWLLNKNGHKVDWTIAKPDCNPTLKGIIPAPRSRVKATDYDLIVFTSTDMGEEADNAKAAGVPVIGDSEFCDLLEDDRLFGIEMMEKAGINVPKWEAFNDIGKAIDYVRHNHKRYVFKPFGDVPKDLTYVSKNEDDMVGFMEKRIPGSGVKEFILQEFIEGTEVSCEGWWTGTEWCAVDYTLEEKKLMSGGIGPNTGSAGSVIWMAERPTPLFQQGLSKISPLLVDADFRGLIDLNTIVTEGKVYGLEWTPRFGYESTCNLTRMLPIEFGEFIHAVATGVTPPNLEPRTKFAATIRCSVPPYPNKVKAKWQEPHQPIKGLDSERLDSFFLFDVDCEGDDLVVCGEGNLGTPIGCSESLCGAFDEVMAAIKRLDVPDLQYRNDVAKCAEKRYETLRSQGWLRLLG